MITLWLITLFVVFAVTVWVALSPLVYSLGENRPTPIPVATADGWVIHVYHRAAATRRFVEPVVLCHGLANNHSFLEFLPPQNLAQFLANLGFDTYSVDHRGDGISRAPDWLNDATFDDLVRFDAPAVLEAVARHSKSERVLWVGHSLGGLLGLASASPTNGRPSPISAVATIGSPVFFHLEQTYGWLLQFAQFFAFAGKLPSDWFGRVIAPLAGRVRVDELVKASANIDNIDARSQRVLLANATSPLWQGVIRQLEDWVRHDVFRSLDRTVDYRANTMALQVPVLVVAGTVDGLAPLSASRDYFAALTTPDKTFAGFGREFGQADDYGHGDLVIGRRANVDVYPTIGEWLVKHATAKS